MHSLEYISLLDWRKRLGSLVIEQNAYLETAPGAFAEAGKYNGVPLQMKPVIKEQTRYNILFMRDDGKARTFRLRRGVLRFFVYFLVLLILISGGVIGAGTYFGTHYLSLLEKTEMQEREIAEMRLQLERLANLESLLTASSSEAAPLAKHEEVGVAAPATRVQNGTQPVDPADPSQLGALPYPPQALPPETAGTPGMSIGMSAEQAPPVAASAQRLTSPASPVRVASFSGRPIGQQRLRIRYELASAERLGSRTVSGIVRHMAVLNDGRSVELVPLDNAETRLTIGKSRPVEISTRLPDGHDTRDIRQIELILSTEDYGAFHEYYDVTQWRSN